MTETTYDVANDGQALTLWAELARLGFDQQVEVDAGDAGSVKDMLSDIDWYAERWEPGTVDTRHDVGYHPVAGDEDEWGTYMWRQGSVVGLVIA